MIESTVWIDGVLTGSDGPKIKHLYGIDTEKYTWVESYIRDQTTRGEIARLKAKISEVQKSPICRDELRQRLEAEIAQVNLARLNQIRNHIIGAQNRETPLMNSGNILEFKFIPYVGLSQADTDSLFADLPQGKPQEEITKEVNEITAKIQELQKRIEEELSPRTRWVYKASGDPILYPKGCRWTAFVKDWETVVARFEGEVNIEGYPFEFHEEAVAYNMLELDKVRKLTPLRKPKKIVKPYDAGTAYRESVKISRG